jgi:hypothetical protein
MEGLRDEDLQDAMMHMACRYVTAEYGATWVAWQGIVHGNIELVWCHGKGW